MVQEHKKVESKNSGTRLVSICPTMVLGPMLQPEASQHEQSATLPHVSFLCCLFMIWLHKVVNFQGSTAMMSWRVKYQGSKCHIRIFKLNQNGGLGSLGSGNLQVNRLNKAPACLPSQHLVFRISRSVKSYVSRRLEDSPRYQPMSLRCRDDRTPGEYDDECFCDPCRQFNMQCPTMHGLNGPTDKSKIPNLLKPSIYCILAWVGVVRGILSTPCIASNSPDSILHLSTGQKLSLGICSKRSTMFNL